MDKLVVFLSQPWPWYVAGPVIAVVMFALLFFGNNLGISANFRTMCAVLGAGRSCTFFEFNWRNQLWNLVFAAGLIIGGFIAHLYLSPKEGVNISSTTIEELKRYGIDEAGSTMIPTSLISWNSLTTLKGVVLMVIGGFLVGFGTRYAGGCTSGHAISGLSDLQLPSVIAVIGFFIGGLFITYLVMPHLLTL